MKLWFEGFGILASFIAAVGLLLVAWPLGVVVLFWSTVWANLYNKKVEETTIEDRESLRRVMIDRSKSVVETAFKADTRSFRKFAASANLN